MTRVGRVARIFVIIFAGLSLLAWLADAMVAVVRNGLVIVYLGAAPGGVIWSAPAAPFALLAAVIVFIVSWLNTRASAPDQERANSFFASED